MISVHMYFILICIQDTIDCILDSYIRQNSKQVQYFWILYAVITSKVF